MLHNNIKYTFKPEGLNVVKTVNAVYSNVTKEHYFTTRDAVVSYPTVTFLKLRLQLASSNLLDNYSEFVIDESWNAADIVEGISEFSVNNGGVALWELGQMLPMFIDVF